MSGVHTDYDENKFVSNLITNYPKKTGWIHKEDTDDWFYIKEKPDPSTHSKLYKMIIIKLMHSDNPVFFNEFSRTMECIVIGTSLVDEHSDDGCLFEPLECFDLNELSVLDFQTSNVYCAYNNSKDGIGCTGYKKLKLKDRRYHTFYFDERGISCTDLIVDGKLCVNGLMADKYMLEGPSKKFGTVMRNKLPYLCSADGTLLNLEKKKLYDEDVDIYYYVNSDKTFFYSKDPDDPKWY